MPKNYSQAKGRRKGHTFLSVPHHIMDSDNFQSLSGSALKLLLDLGRQFNGINNGDLCVTMSVMKQRGWKSNDTLQRAKNELLEKGWITLTRQGGLNIKCSLYALTWLPIDDCKGKIEVSPTRTPSNHWKGWSFKEPTPRKAEQSGPITGAVGAKKVVSLYRKAER